MPPPPSHVPLTPPFICPPTSVSFPAAIVRAPGTCCGTQYSLKELPSLKNAYSWCKPKMMEGHAGLAIHPRESIAKVRQGPMGGKEQDGDGRLDMKHVKWVHPPPFSRRVGTKAPAATLLPEMTTVSDCGTPFVANRSRSRPLVTSRAREIFFVLVYRGGSHGLRVVPFGGSVHR